METETPQSQIASYLAKSLRKKLLGDIRRSWEHQEPEHQEPEVYKAKAGLTELSDILQSIHIYDQHKQISNDCLDDWLWRFKDFFYTTENVLDDLDFIEFRSRDWAGNDVSSSYEVEEMDFMKAIAELPEVTETAAGLLGEIKQFEKELQKSKPVCSSLDQQRNTSSGLRTLPSKVRELKGRAVEKAKILEALLHKAEGESKESPVMISITGPVGIGKTELARAVYNSAQVEAEFDVRAWIYIGNYPLDVWWLTLQRSVSASVDKQGKIHRTIGSSLGDSILETMKTEIKGKKVLIVLDNLTEWFDADMVEYGAKVGSRIIATSEFQHHHLWTERAVRLQFDVELDGLEEEEYLELFKECALGDRNRNKYPELEDILGEIAKRFGGNPLAAVMIGRHLKWHQSEERWRMISRSNLGMIDPTESNLLSLLLRRSYDQLPRFSKQSYLAFALFPKNFAFEEGQLYRIWNATGFNPYENTGSFSERSFFVSSAKKNGKLVLHATLHELADRICDGEFFRLEDEIEEEDDVAIPHKAQHVYVTADNFVKVYRVLQKKTHLRSLVIGGILSSEEHKIKFMELLEEVLLNLKDLRLLMISVLPTGKLPDAIGSLRHLRHLEFPGESIQELPTWLLTDQFVGLRGVRLLDAISIAILKSASSVQELPTQKSTESTAKLENPSSVQVLPIRKSTKSKAILKNPSSVQEHLFRKIDEEIEKLSVQEHRFGKMAEEIEKLSLALSQRRSRDPSTYDREVQEKAGNQKGFVLSKTRSTIYKQLK